MKLYLLLIPILCIKCLYGLYCDCRQPHKKPEVKAVSTFQFVPANVLVQINY